jgi:hypothetical protein
VFLSRSGVNGDDHPVWMMRKRNDIPQPGSFTRYHWSTALSSDVRAGTVPVSCDVAMAGQPEGASSTATRR